MRGMDENPSLLRSRKLRDVVNHYDTFKGLRLTEGEKNDLVEFLKSL